jgi:hypothetical protein
MDAGFLHAIISELAMRPFLQPQHIGAFLVLFLGIACTARADVISIDSSFLFVQAPPVTLEQQTIYFHEEGYTPAEMGFPGMTTQEVIALMEEPEHSITAVPEPSTWAMILLGFAGLSFAGYRASQRVATAAA